MTPVDWIVLAGFVVVAVVLLRRKRPPKNEAVTLTIVPGTPEDQPEVKHDSR